MGKLPTPAPSKDPHADLSKEACERLEACEKQKAEFDQDIRESYFFAAPHRAREVRSAQPASQSKPTDACERQIAIASELARDFVTEVVNAFMPPAEPWIEQKPGMFLPDEIRTKAMDIIGKQTPVILDAIRSSNLYEIIPMAWSPDLPVGTTAMWIADPRPAENMVVQAVPLHEIEINIGPYGDIDDRFWVRHTRNRHVKALLGDENYGKVPAETRKRIEGKPTERTIIRWGFWRLWERMDDVVWKHVVMLDKKVIDSVEIKGEGCCPLMIMRFNPSPEWAFGSGPLIESLEDLRLLDSLEGDKIDHIELKLRPPIAYPSDSFAAVENGIETGSAYPIRPEEAAAVKPIFEGGDIEGALFETSVIEDRLRRRFFLGFPQQKGKTPPTATQFIETMQELQRRIGTPGMSFWREGPAQIFLRFKYLLEKRGKIEPVKVEGKTVAVTPFNPAQRAAEMQEVMIAAQFAQMVAPLFPEEWRMSVNGEKTMAAIKAKMRAGLIVFRTDSEKKAALAQISQLIEGRQRIDPGQPAQPGPVVA